MNKFKLTIAYDGTGYEGWQVQKIGTGVQEKLEAALAKLFPSHPRVHSSSRTDTGVHALGMVAHFEVPPSECPMSSAQTRPGHQCLAARGHPRAQGGPGAQTDFHARFDATGKQYRYFVWNHPAMNPLLRRTAWHVPRPLDLAAHAPSRAALRGPARFPVLRRQSRLRQRNPPCATSARCEIKEAGALLTFIIEGDGFLYKMCRGIVGTLVQAGLGKFPAERIERIAGQKGSSCGRHDRPGARAGFVEGVLSEQTACTSSWSNRKSLPTRAMSPGCAPRPKPLAPG